MLFNLTLRQKRTYLAIDAEPPLARGSARSENSSGEQFGVASRAISPAYHRGAWTRDGSLIAAHKHVIMGGYGCLSVMGPVSP